MEVGTRAKILLVDDEEDFIVTLSERLEARGLPSTVVHCGEDALATLAGGVPDVVVLDLKMPGMGGLEVLRQLRERRVHSKVIILTGHGSELEQRRAEELGAFAYLNKPVDIDVLGDTMRRALLRLEAEESAAGAR